MGALTTALTVATAASKAYGAYAGYRAGQENRRAANRMADDVEAVAEFEATQARRGLTQLLGAQRTAIAAGQGIDASTGTAARLAEQTERIGEEDIAQMRLNAAREAWGIRRQASINARAATNQAIAGGIGAAADLVPMGSTLLTRGVDRWRQFRGTQRAMGALNQAGVTPLQIATTLRR